MYGASAQYLEAEKLRLRANAAETIARRWRAAAWTLGLLAIVLIVLLSMAVTVVMKADDIVKRSTEEAEQYRALAEHATANFERCKVANAGLVESLQDFDVTIKAQKQLIGEAIDLAKRCDSRGAIWAYRHD